MPPFNTLTHKAHKHAHKESRRRSAIIKATLVKADMTEPSRGLFYLPIIYLWTGGVEADVLASLAPPVHLSGERLGWTLLVCMVSDFRRGRLEVRWRSASEDHMSTGPYSIAVTRRHRGHNAVAVITVATSDWPSYSCSVSHRHRSKVTRTHLTTSSDIAVRTNAAVVLALRLILMKILVFDALVTIYVVIK
ncbi:uncharacterized protein LOC118469508 isoform X2 [Amphiprion ocellaris]|uniref:uncharacterized protein LOC118469508 isoform X2 n=1 Tax=Amphiprion ocellaris TaxID=80972 RepID=UPI00164A079F|nr:uncharacterized protein LOC118469508 isoform X2 [Amphiprion ocellaris]